jgi:prepilin-type N-terminal cleavage/methylation domain-containing protein
MNSARLRERSAGFTLIELMVVVVIIGILAGMAISRYNMSSHRSKQKEADLLLKQVYQSHMTYIAEHGTAAPDVDALVEVGFEPPPSGSLNYYSWSGDIDLPLCLQSTGTWSDRGINAQGDIDDC